MNSWRKIEYSVFLKDVPFGDTTEVEDYFSKFGAVERAVLLKDKETGELRRLGFVVFRSKDSFDRCLAASPFESGGVVFAGSPARRRNVLFVYDIPSGVTSESLKAEFPDAGIKFVFVKDRAEPPGRRFGFIGFLTEEDRARFDPSGSSISGCSIRFARSRNGPMGRKRKNVKQ